MLRLENLSIDAHDPSALASFWEEALGWRRTHEEEAEVVIEPTEGRGEGGSLLELIFLKVPETKSVKNRLHIDLRPDDQEAEVARLEALGARRVEIGQSKDPAATWIVLADPEGNEFCILRSAPPAD